NAECGTRNPEQSEPRSFAEPCVQDRTPRDQFRVPPSAFRVPRSGWGSGGAAVWVGVDVGGSFRDLVAPAQGGTTEGAKAAAGRGAGPVGPEVVLERLGEDEGAGVVATVRALSPPPEALAVALLFAFRHAEHERRLVAALRDALPDIPVAASHEVLPVFREF